jgi:hypothetical protein
MEFYNNRYFIFDHLPMEVYTVDVKVASFKTGTTIGAHATVCIHIHLTVGQADGIDKHMKTFYDLLSVAARRCSAAAPASANASVAMVVTSSAR